MFPLAGKEFPKSSEELAAAIQAPIDELFTLPKRSAGVSVQGGKFPAVKAVTLDLDGATLTATDAPPKPVGTGKRKPGVTVDKLEISAHPIRYQGAKLELDVSAKGLTFDYDRDKRGHPLLVLTDAKDGKVAAKISKADLQALMLEGATLAAKQQGVTVQELDLDLTSDGPRSVGLDVRVKARKLMMSGVIHVQGNLAIDDELNATVSNLSCQGEGVVGSAAAGFLQKKIEPYNGHTIPLMAFSLGDVTLRDLKIKLNGALQVTAAFGSK